MRTNIDIDDDLMGRAMQAGPYKTKKDAVEAGLKLLARQAAYREILKWEGKLRWEGDEAVDWTRPPEPEPVNATKLVAAEPAPPRLVADAKARTRAKPPAPLPAPRAAGRRSAAAQPAGGSKGPARAGR
ncbi:MAG: type II toxin-antitoxin system VapB family antitoxin [Rubrivivax sp.]|nr:type II toxin-antitoxin system VapB family antitoxin [Rubrivivax sp.]